MIRRRDHNQNAALYRKTAAHSAEGRPPTGCLYGHPLSPNTFFNPARIACRHSAVYHKFGLIDAVNGCIAADVSAAPDKNNVLLAQSLTVAFGDDLLVEQDTLRKIQITALRHVFGSEHYFFHGISPSFQGYKGYRLYTY